MSQFPCDSCGLCCKLVGKVIANKHVADPKIKRIIDAFPYKTTNTGACEKLNDDNTCAVYDSRPVLCDVRLMAVVRGQPIEQAYSQAQTICDELKRSNANL